MKGHLRLEYSLTIVSPSLSGSQQEWSCLCSDKLDPLTGHTKAYSRQKDKQEVVRVNKLTKLKPGYMQCVQRMMIHCICGYVSGSLD